MTTTPLTPSPITRPREGDECRGLALVAHIEALIALGGEPDAKSQS